jgi:hypothetical protein
MEEWWQENPKRREHFWQAMEMQFLEGSVTPDREEEPFLLTSFSSPRQLLNLYQAFISAGDSNVSGKVYSMLRPFDRYPAGATGISIEDYVKLLDQIDKNLSLVKSDTLIYTILRRQEQLTIARQDRWHWNMLFNPSDLIDLDLVVLGTTMIDRTGHTVAFDNIVRERGKVVAAPFIAAKVLRPGV